MRSPSHLQTERRWPHEPHERRGRLKCSCALRIALPSDEPEVEGEEREERKKERERRGAGPKRERERWIRPALELASVRSPPAPLFVYTLGRPWNVSSQLFSRAGGGKARVQHTHSKRYRTSKLFRAQSTAQRSFPACSLGRLSSPYDRPSISVSPPWSEQPSA